MNNTFSEPCREAISFAKDEAARLYHDYIGTEHLLLGLIRQGENRALEILTAIGIEISDLKESIEEVVQPSGGKIMPDVLPLSARSKRVLEYSGQIARAFKSEQIQPEHLLLALLKDEEGVAAQVLSMYDIRYTDAYLELTGNKSDPEKIRHRQKIIGFSISEALGVVLANAHEEALRLESGFVGVTHLTLGLIRLENDPAVEILKKNGVDLEKLKAELEMGIVISWDDRMRVDVVGKQIRFSRSLKLSGPAVNAYANRSIREACAIAHKNGLTEVTTACLLLAVLRQEKTVARKILAEHNVKHEDILASLVQALQPKIRPLNS